jgi:hypothetical protein
MFRLIKSAGLLILLCTAAVIPNGQSGSPSQNAPHVASSKDIHPTMILWNTGTLETITPALLADRKTWRITHYPQDPTVSKTNDYDLYDLDRITLAPLRSVRNTDEYYLELVFGEKEVKLRKTTNQETTEEQIPLSTAVEPEGPGLGVFVAGLPLAVGYKTQYMLVDRWGGHDSSRVKMVTLSVSRKMTENTAMGRHDLYEVFIRPDDNSFRIKEKVFAESPHFPVWVEYTRAGKTYPASEVIAMVKESTR